MIYDALNYVQQVSEKTKQHRENKDVRDDEFLSGFAKTDRLKPVITLTVYFGSENWDGPRSLKDMFGRINENVLRYVSDYKLNLIIPKEIKDFNKFSTDFGKAMKYISVADEKEEYKRVSNQEEYRTVSVETARLLNECIGLQIPIKKGESEVNMCKAWEEIKLEGREEGIKEGIKEGKLEILFELVKEKIIDAAEAAARVSMSEKEFKESMKKAGY